MKALLKWVQDEVISWWNEQTLMRKVIISLLVIMVIFLCFKYPDPTRNLILLIAGLTGLYFLNRRTITAEQSTEAAEQSAVTAEKGLTTERFTRAIDQLASDKRSIRLGGIRSLEQIADAHEEERTKIMEILSARIRELAPADNTKQDKERGGRPDIKSAVEALVKIAAPFMEKKRNFCSLYKTDLSGLDFYEIDLSYLDIKEADLSHSIFVNVNFTKSQLDGCNVSGAFFSDPIGIVAEQRDKAFCWKGDRPADLPRGLHLEERQRSA